MKNPHMPWHGQAGEANQEIFSHFMGPQLAWGPVCSIVRMLRGSDRPDALVLFVLFPPKAAPGKRRYGSFYRLATVGHVLANDPALISTIQGDLAQRPGYSLGLVVNEPLPVPVGWGGEKQWGASNAHIAQPRWLFSECDHEEMSAVDQLQLARFVFGVEPTFSVHTGGKSVHVYYRLKESVSTERFTQLQRLVGGAYEHLSPGCKVDRSLSKPAQVMRLAGGYHPHTGALATIHTASDTVINADALEARLRGLLPPPPPVPTTRLQRPRLASARHRGGPVTMEQIREGLDRIAPFVSGQGQRPEFIRFVGGLRAVVLEAGGSDAVALALVLEHSPGVLDAEDYFKTDWSRITAGSFWYLGGGAPKRGADPRFIAAAHFLAAKGYQ